MKSVTPYLLCLTLSTYPLGAWGSDNSRDSSGNSNASSENSNASSDNSNQSSEGSNESSNDSSQNSSDRSTDNTTEGSSDSTSGPETRGTWIVVTAILLLGAVSMVVFFAVRSTVKSEEEEAQANLQRFMRDYHAGLVRDLTVGNGPILSALTHELDLTAQERERLLSGIARSEEQLALLHSLAGPIGPEDARRFAVAFNRIGAQSLGTERWRSLMHQHLGTAQGGQLLGAP